MSSLQAKNENSTNGQARWPKKSAVFLLNLLKNAESNAEVPSPPTFDRGIKTIALFQCAGQYNLAQVVRIAFDTWLFKSIERSVNSDSS